MKKIIAIGCLLIFIALGNVYAQKKVAVVTFYINKQIDVKDFGGAAYLAVTKLGDDPAFNLSPLLKEFHAQFFDTYANDFPFQLLTEKEVVNNAAYKAFTPNGVATSGILNVDNFLTPAEGYKVLLPELTSGNENEMLKIFSGVDGIMKVYIDFKLVKIGLGGMGVVKVQARTNIILYNKNGDKVFSTTEDAKSKGVSPMVGGLPVMTTDKIMPMCESALNELMINLQKDMAKMIKKADAKL